MILKLATKMFGSSNDRILKTLGKHVPAINELESRYEPMSDSELQAQSNEFRQRLENGEPLDNLTHETFAVVREAAKRVLGQRHYDVQLLGGLALNDGMIAEMRTGEGKTQVAALAVYLNALSGKGVHVVTVNDYLAQRDADWMGQIYGFLGLSTGCITNDVHDAERQAAYACDVTYGTNNEYGFDYLRDNMKFSLDQMVQRPFNFAIVDEVDSILIDEARTPLIISGPSESNTVLYTAVDKLIPSLDDTHYDMDEKHRSIILNEEGMEKVEDLLREHGLLTDGNMYDMQNIGLVHHVNQALRANKLFHADKDYIINEGRVVLIDEFTGRMMDGRRLSEGLHQALEAKEDVHIQNENQTLASITFQNYFRLYPKLSGMTGTAMTEAAEFHDIYKLGVVDIPTHVPVSRQDYEDKIYKSADDKNVAVIKLIRECAERRQPILVGTVSIEKSESLSAALKKAKIKHKVLNARHHENEASIIAQAGQPGAVTIATNMAGRGTDIKLGGNLEMRVAEEVDDSLSDAKKKTKIAAIEKEIAANKKIVIEAGGLYVVGTERHESRRIDNQLRGRSGRQGDPGASMFFLGVDDDLMRIFAGDRLESLLSNSAIGLKDGESLEHPMISKMLERAQGKVEGMNYEVRKNLLKFDDVMNDQRKVIYDQRREIMEQEDIADLIKEMRHDYISELVARCIPLGSYADQWDIEHLQSDIRDILTLDLPITDWAKEEGIADQEIEDRLVDISDKRMAEKAADVGLDAWRRVEKGILLQILDQNWKEHLLNLDHLRQGINLRAFGQRDPLNEYKAEAFSLFSNMLDNMTENVVQTLSLVEVNHEEGRSSLFMPGMMPEEQETHETRQDPANKGQEPAQPFVRKKGALDRDDPSTWGKVARNSPCPCGAKRKFKHCHGKLG